jgi:hypothetical protein
VTRKSHANHCGRPFAQTFFPIFISFPHDVNETDRHLLAFCMKQGSVDDVEIYRIQPRLRPPQNLYFAEQVH